MVRQTFEFFLDKDDDFSLNICLQDILNEKTIHYIYSLLEKYQVGNQVIFEFLETEKIENYPQVEGFIEKIRSFGCRIAVDDFGSGYANFDYLIRLDFDYLKIDSSLIKNICTDENSRIMVEAIVGFSRKLGLKTIAEYVHSEDVFEKVRSLGIDYSQGYYIGKPGEGLNHDSEDLLQS